MAMGEFYIVVLIIALAPIGTVATIAALAYLVTLQMAFATLNTKYCHIWPVAVWLNLIPLFNIFWHFTFQFRSHDHTDAPIAVSNVRIHKAAMAWNPLSLSLLPTWFSRDSPFGTISPEASRWASSGLPRFLQRS